MKETPITAQWEIWHDSLITTYGDRGWSDIDYVIDFKYLKGSLHEYATKKLNLLLDLDPTMSLGSRILFTVHGLPNYIKNRLSRKNITNQEQLINELIQLENLTNTRKSNSQYFKANTNTKYNEKKKACTLCEKKGYKDRIHAEEKCWFHPDNKNDRNAPWNRISSNISMKTNTSNNNNKPVKIANNVELENELNNDETPKN